MKKPKFELTPDNGLSQILLGKYVMLCEKEGVDQEYIDKIYDLIKEFREWAQGNLDRVRIPNTNDIK